MIDVGFIPRTTLLGLLTCVAAVGADLPGRSLPMSRTEWRLYLPTPLAPGSEGAVDLLVHFHGDSATVARNAEEAGLGAVVVTVNYAGLSSVYTKPFSDPGLFQRLLDEALALVRSRPEFGADARWGRVAVSSFSAGYGAVREILKQPRYVERVNGVLAADSLYASTDERDSTPVDEQMADYKAFADLAARGEKTFIVTHSEVVTPTYESTRETGDELLAHLGLAPTAIDQPGLGTLRFTRKAQRGRFTLWGAAGATGDDHMAHLRYLAEWLDDLPLERPARKGAAVIRP